MFLTYEKKIIWPLLQYKGLYQNFLELPQIGNIKFSFKLKKKEFVFILTFLSFFFKCFFLEHKVTFNINYNDLYMEIKIKNKNKDFYFYLILVNILSKFLVNEVKVKKHYTEAGSNTKLPYVLKKNIIQKWEKKIK